jgi:hypothetical protein
MIHSRVYASLQILLFPVYGRKGAFDRAPRQPWKGVVQGRVAKRIDVPSAAVPAFRFPKKSYKKGIKMAVARASMPSSG